MGLAQAIARFSDEVIDSACSTLESLPQGEYRRLPTPYELVKACEAENRPTVRETKYCGRCTDGRIRGSDNEWRRCECECVLCENTGFVIEQRAVPRYTGTIGFAKRCPNGCKVYSSAA